jgi:hypothetical protein
MEAIFRDGKEPELFVAALVQAGAKTNWQIHPFAAEISRAEGNTRRCGTDTRPNR